MPAEGIICTVLLAIITLSIEPVNSLITISHMFPSVSLSTPIVTLSR